MANREKSTASTTMAAQKAATRQENSRALARCMAQHSLPAESIQSCFESSQRLLRAIMLICAAGELEDDDLAALNEVVMMAMNLTEIGYHRYLLEE